MSQIIYYGIQQNWIVSGTPDSETILGQGQTLNVNDIVLDTSTNIEYRITGLGTFDSDTQTWTGTTFKQAVFDANILTTLDAQGWYINTTRGYTDQSSLGFNTSRQPSLTNDTQVKLSVTLANTLLTTSTATLEISPDDTTFEPIAVLANLTEAVNSSTYSDSGIIPAGYYYRVSTSGGGTQTLVILKELSL